MTQVRTMRDGDLLRITLDGPETRNAQTPQTWRTLAQIGASLDPAVRVVVLDGVGPSFSAGLDRRMFTPEGVDGESLGSLATLNAAALDARISTFQDAFTWWRDCDAITIAAVQGHAIGAGAQLMLACDLAVIADDLHFALPEVRLGLVPDLGGTGALRRRVGAQRALDLCVTARTVGADEAMAIGLADRRAHDLAAGTSELVRHILALPADAVRAAKRLLVVGDGQEELARERRAQIPLIRGLASGLAGRGGQP